MDVTSNNSNAMKTEVELYMDRELSDITFDVEALDEWKQITSELGLEKQMALTKGKESPVPFPYMNESMQRVYGMICPEKVNVRDYNKTPIPLEVMKQLAFCKKENHFSYIQIWYDDKSPDPLVVGIIAKYYFYGTDENGETKKVEGIATKKECKEHKYWASDSDIYEEEKNHYLVARWGDVKRSFEELKQMAKERFIEKHANQMKSDIEKLQSKLKVL